MSEKSVMPKAMTKKQRLKALSWETAFVKYKKRYPDLDRQSFIWGFVAAINAVVKDSERAERR